MNFGDRASAENGLASADMGSTVRATKVACISLTASSGEMLQPSLRISAPKILAAMIAPLVQARIRRRFLTFFISPRTLRQFATSARFIQRESFEPQANEIPKNMPS